MFRFIQYRRMAKVIKILSPILLKGYGRRDYFSIGQIQASSQTLSQRQQKFALALFADPQDLAGLEDASLFHRLRKEISHDFFTDADDYTANDVLNVLGSGGWKGGSMNDDMSNRNGMNGRY
ncbi:DUF6559 family protein [Vibrio ezurae]|uniref:Uncharacterized protein n=1 Tax=Vibrio ezurae NBRC 102218 TaxID=1219080 RepID=U3B3K6_9VIBR|nr:DUF6559 family protein [Vibrio ezurae]GAD80042.1 hypothetical protein VEZ01S_22_00500 [Vibrio ezurae NBRC 102218]